VTLARALQQARQGTPNAQLAGRNLEERARETTDARKLLRAAVERLGLSGRAHHRVLRVARTIADLESAKQVEAHHVGEALGYRDAIGTSALPGPMR
jgi:magnesium chelatase family protein